MCHWLLKTLRHSKQTPPSQGNESADTNNNPNDINEPSLPFTIPYPSEQLLRSFEIRTAFEEFENSGPARWPLLDDEDPHAEHIISKFNWESHADRDFEIHPIIQMLAHRAIPELYPPNLPRLAVPDYKIGETEPPSPVMVIQRRRHSWAALDDEQYRMRLAFMEEARHRGYIFPNA